METKNLDLLPAWQKDLILRKREKRNNLIQSSNQCLILVTSKDQPNTNGISSYTRYALGNVYVSTQDVENRCAPILTVNNIHKSITSSSASSTVGRCATSPTVSQKLFQTHSAKQCGHISVNNSGTKTSGNQTMVQQSNQPSAYYNQNNTTNNKMQIINNKINADMHGKSYKSEEDNPEEFQYGPGIVSKLKSKYLSLTLRECTIKSRPSILRRSTSLENLLDEDDPKEDTHNRKYITNNVNGKIQRYRGTNRNPTRGNDSIKRARSVETLLKTSNTYKNELDQVEELREVQQMNIKNQQVNRPKRIAPLLEERERPPADLVKTTLKLFEASAAKRKSCKPVGDVAVKVDAFKTIIKTSKKPVILKPKPAVLPKPIMVRPTDIRGTEHQDTFKEPSIVKCSIETPKPHEELPVRPHISKMTEIFEKNPEPPRTFLMFSETPDLVPSESGKPMKTPDIVPFPFMPQCPRKAKAKSHGVIRSEFNGEIRTLESYAGDLSPLVLGELSYEVEAPKPPPRSKRLSDSSPVKQEVIASQGVEEEHVGRKEVVVAEKEVVVGEKEVVVGEKEVIVGEKEVIDGEKEVIVEEKELIFGEQEVFVGETEDVVGEKEGVIRVKEVLVEKKEIIEKKDDVGEKEEVLEEHKEAVNGQWEVIMTNGFGKVTEETTDGSNISNEKTETNERDENDYSPKSICSTPKIKQVKLEQSDDKKYEPLSVNTFFKMQDRFVADVPTSFGTSSPIDKRLEAKCEKKEVTKKSESVSASESLWNSGKSPASSWQQNGNTMVFNFSNRKDVPDYIENDGLIRRVKRERPKPGESGIIVLADADFNESSTDDDWAMLLSGPLSPCDVIFENDNVLCGDKSSFLKQPRQHKLKIKFDDSATETFEYPSEMSMCLDDSTSFTSNSSLPLANNASATKHLPSPNKDTIFCNYTPSKMNLNPDDYQLGLSPRNVATVIQTATTTAEDYLKPATDATKVAWGSETVADLLF